MKKAVFFVSIVLLILSLAACSGGNGVVEITVPASFEKLKADGVSEVAVNDDGSVTYKMSRATHEKMLREVRDEIAGSIDEMKNGQTFKSVKDIEHNNKFTEFTLIVDREAYEKSFDGVAVLGLAVQGLLYQILDGVPQDRIRVAIHIKDQAAGDVFHTINYPER
jgi:hypothetical protein